MPQAQDANGNTQDQLDYDAEQLELAATTGTGPAAKESAADAADARVAAATLSNATAKGWVPQADFTGDPAKWVDAATFVERGNNFSANLKKEVASLKTQLATFKGTAEAFQKFHAEAMKGKQKELDSALMTLKRDHREAIRDGDDDAADAIEGRIASIHEEKAEVAASAIAAPVPEDAQTPELKAWVEEGNQWFESDPKMQKYALGIAEELVAKGETLRGRPFLDKIAEMMREEFPAKFSNPNRQRQGAAESSGKAAAAASAGRGERDLPAADRALMRDFVAQGWTTKEKFLADYRW